MMTTPLTAEMEWADARATIQVALMDPDNACLGIREAERAFDIAQEALAALAQSGFLNIVDPDGEGEVRG